MGTIHKGLKALLLLLISGTLLAQTTGELNVSVSTSNAGGNYAPAHVVAIWVEDDQGNFVKTLLVYAANRKTHLNTWQTSTSNAGSEYNVVDAITGATQYTHTTRTCTWDGTDYIGNDMPDGEYTIWMELTDKNSTGNYSSFSFTKGTENITLNPDNAPSFSDVEIIWTADQTGTSNVVEKSINISPNPGNGIIHLNYTPKSEISIYNLAGKKIRNVYSNIIDISDQPKGIYLIKIESLTTLKYIKSN